MQGFSPKIIKVAISLSLLTASLYFVDFNELLIQAKSLSPVSLFIIFSIYCLGQVLSSVKWWIILGGSGNPEVKFTKALKAYFAGIFVNVLGLGTAGGDITRSVMIGIPKTDAIMTVALDRIHGLMVLLSIGVTSYYLFTGDVATLTSTRLDFLPYFMKLATAGIAVALAVLFLNQRFGLTFASFSKKLRLHEKVSLIASQLDKVIGIVSYKNPAFFLITLISALFHLSQISLYYYIFLQFGVGVSLPLLLVAIPFINIVSTLPISWQGLGVREEAVKFVFVPMFMNDEQAIIIGAVWLLAMTTSAVLGGAFAFGSSSLRSNRE